MTLQRSSVIASLPESILMSLKDDLLILYRDLDAEIAARGWFCRACGDCCCFEESGQILYCSSVEAEYLAESGELPETIKEGVCPFLVDHHCSRRDHRTVCCRSYFCGLSGSGEMEELTERYLKRLKELHYRAGVLWEYHKLADHLKRRKPNGCKK